MSKSANCYSLVWSEVISEIRRMIHNYQTNNNQKIELVQPGIRITIFGVPYEMDTKYVLSKINQYCVANKIIRCTYRDHPFMYNGVCFIYTKKVDNPIPSNLTIQGCRLGVKYEGQPQPDRKCYVCQVEGHTARDCPSRPPPPPISPITDKEGSGAFQVYNPRKKAPNQISKSVGDLLKTIRNTSTPIQSNKNNLDTPATPGWVPDEAEWENVEESDYDKSKEEIAQRSSLIASTSKAPIPKAPKDKRSTLQDTPLSSRSNSKDRKRDRDRSSLLEDHKKHKIATHETSESRESSTSMDPSNSTTRGKATQKKNK
ncbi:hypothetical protein LOTGIDRAFT_166021 [Lottia gigantea]|uniref:CCHC-type domain-containing protein n=1 Tax=Lottia gigantea TaxID=225164 RepID=V3ZUG7_LOTGI|nr:hypothetical protein LOTGIDRAFT_166021 [Lottia gigantea]ESO88002.1 hypothetical protein LOTGIDRAFT_166021 [Lottia gigantea]